MTSFLVEFSNYVSEIGENELPSYYFRKKSLFQKLFI